MVCFLSEEKVTMTLEVREEERGSQCPENGEIDQVSVVDDDY